MKQINFIFTKNGFHIDETKEENTSSWAILFKKYKYSALYELGFENNLKGLTPSAFYLYQLSQKFVELLSNRSELEVAREDTKVEASNEECPLFLLRLVQNSLMKSGFKTYLKS